jgi:hypothetical protein
LGCFLYDDWLTLDFALLYITHSYDVYTPTVAIAFHDNGPQSNGHGNDEWFRHQRQRFRVEAIDRAKAPLQLKLQDGTLATDTALANLGLYGLGKRRTLKQLEEFTKVDFASQQNNDGKGETCVNLEYVPFDASVSPVDNYYDEPDDLDPQPEYPLRTKTIFYEQVVQTTPISRNIAAVDWREADVASNVRVDSFQRMDGIEQTNLPPVSTLLVLWAFGMMVWCVTFRYNAMSSGSGGGGTPRKKYTKQLMSKDV